MAYIVVGIFLLLAIIAFIAGFAGLVKPSLIKQNSRGKAFGIGMVAFSVFFIAAIIATPKGEDAKQEATKTAKNEQQETETISREQKDISQIEKKQKLQPVEKKFVIKAKAHAYKVIDARDFRVETRKTGQWSIVSEAVTKEDRAATAMAASKDLFNEMNEAQVATVWLFLDEDFYKHGIGHVAEVKYIPDGKGESGTEQNANTWHVKAADTRISKEQKKILTAWYQNKDNFRDKDGLVDEEKLVHFLAQKFKLSVDEINKKITPYFFSYFSMESLIVEGWDIKRIGSKKAESVKNPITFTASACQQDLQCWGNKHSIRATFVCKPYIEKLAKYDFEWTDGWLDSKFSHFRWKNRKEGAITFLGDKIKLQNGFGAWQSYVYECDYLPNKDKNENGTVLDIRVREGKI